MDHRQVERDALLTSLRDARFSDGLFCPRCGHRQVQRWGTFSGRQRYRCKGCRRTFSDLTGTPAAYLKKIELLPRYSDCLTGQASIRRCALQLGIHPSTAFRWRHRLLDWMREHDDETVSGWVELGSFGLPVSHKGQKGQRDLESRSERSPRPGSRGRWNLFYDGPRVQVAIACDRTGRIVSGRHPHPAKVLSVDALESVLQGRIQQKDRLNLTASREARSAAIIFAARLGATFHDAFSRSRSPFGPRAGVRGMRGRTGSRIRGRPGERSLVHVRTVVPYIRRLRVWLRRFRGVATKYLPNYLIWHRLVDSDMRNRFTSLLLRWSG